MFSKTTYYELFKPLAEAQALLKQVADGAESVSDRKNPYKGMHANNGLSATLSLKNSRVLLKNYTAELRESEGVVWLKITVSPSPIAIVIGVALLLLAIAALSGLPIPPIVIPIAVILPYFYFMGFAKDANILGAMVDPVYFNSPMAQAKVGAGIMEVLSSFIVPYYIICIVGIIVFFVFLYIKMFT